MGFMQKMVVNTAKGFVISSATALAVSSISNMLGLNDSLVGRILAVGIPMMGFTAAKEPSITERLFGASKKKGRKKKKSKKEAEKDYFNIFGKDKAKKMNKAIAKEADATEEEVNGVMSFFLPYYLDAIEEEEPEDSNALGKLFKKDEEEVEKKNPSLAKMMMKAMF